MNGVGVVYVEEPDAGSRSLKTNMYAPYAGVLLAMGCASVDERGEVHEEGRRRKWVIFDSSHVRCTWLG